MWNFCEMLKMEKGVNYNSRHHNHKKTEKKFFQFFSLLVFFVFLVNVLFLEVATSNVPFFLFCHFALFLFNNPLLKLHCKDTEKRAKQNRINPSLWTLSHPVLFFRLLDFPLNSVFCETNFINFHQIYGRIEINWGCKGRRQSCTIGTGKKVQQYRL